MIEYLSDPRDQAVLASAPTLMQPRYGELPPCPVQTHRYVAAQDGLYLQARTAGLDLCLRVAPVEQGPLPYGSLREHVRLAGGRIPWPLYQTICREAARAAPAEWACLVLHDPEQGYRLHIPRVASRSAGHIRYLTGDYDPDQVVIDLHTHGLGDAFFSATDDADDRAGGIYLSVVLGRCVAGSPPMQVTRVVAHGHLIPVELALWGGA